ncbi:helix-turn-helix domain-containing protein [Xenorhabdus sp. XENO-1]|uniref:helix-turn-helix domain-containing protein n=1 Tax=Xenorhabdus bovienii TaxID=40576 RepID=UPI0020CA3790|nr:helix-turn-helix domain-containing protein [Xenorhabdus bovienii]MCP9270338.1 helix-turn-helix domain-containing protein [Xenorhabdus bovienii subsp. africana]
MNWFDIAKDQMKALGITYDKLSEHLGITRGAVGHWLNGRREPSLKEIAEILDFIGIKHVILNSDGTISSADDQSSNSINIESEPRLTKKQKELLELFDNLPAEEADKFLRELKVRSAHFDAIFAEMLAKRGIKAS